MPQIEITLPSGARGRIRGLKGEEINLFANKQVAKRNKTGLQILRNVWVETLDAGPLYDGKIDWENAPQCDRFTALFKARIATFGPEFAFPWKCGDCSKKYEWTLDLNDLDVRPLPSSSIENFKAGNRFTTSVQDENGEWRDVVFQLLTQRLEDKIEEAHALAPREKATAGLAQRIVEVKGLEVGKGPIKKFLAQLDAGSFFDLINAMDEVDGGINTLIDIECPHCGHMESVELPLDSGSFWTPQRKKKSSNVDPT